MTSTHDGCCAEFERAAGLSRRRFLQGVAATSGAAVATSVFGSAFRETAFGATTGGNVLVVLSLRGGIDGLGMVVPHGDPAYYAARPRIAVPRTSLVAQDSFFGLHPEMKPLEWLWNGGELAAVHAAGMTHPNRSHFEAMEEVEDADPGSSVRSGWVNRMIGLDADAEPQEAIQLSGAITPTALTGAAPTMAVDGLGGISLPGADPKYDDATWRRRRTTQLHTMWDTASGPIGSAGRAAIGTAEKLSPMAAAPYTPQNGASYPTAWPAHDLAAVLKDTAKLIRADVGTEVVAIDYGSWDLHSDYGTLDWGQMQSLIAAFASSLNAFFRDLGTLRSRVTVVTISEFGRRVAENGNMGLDHGWGNMMLLLGGGVNGGHYYGRWPGLGTTKLVEGDLAVTTDYCNVLGEVVTKRFADRPVSKVFPGLTYRPLGLVT